MSYIEAFFCQKVTVIPYIRYGAGEPVYGEPYDMMCRIQIKKAIASTSSGMSGVTEEVIKSGLMFCVGHPKGTPIPVKSIVRYFDDEFVVKSCEPCHTFTFSHFEVTLG